MFIIFILAGWITFLVSYSLVADILDYLITRRRDKNGKYYD